MSNDNKEALKEIGNWITRGLLAIVCFFLIRTVDTLDETQRTLSKLETKIEVLYNRVVRLESDVKELSSEFKEHRDKGDL